MFTQGRFTAEGTFLIFTLTGVSKEEFRKALTMPQRGDKNKGYGDRYSFRRGGRVATLYERDGEFRVGAADNDTANDLFTFLQGKFPSLQIATRYH